MHMYSILTERVETFQKTNSIILFYFTSSYVHILPILSTLSLLIKDWKEKIIQELPYLSFPVIIAVQVDMGNSHL